jgi:MerR family transcriptional regulator/heat shock protein HspR
MWLMSEIFFISVAARELGMHPQTLRKYERLGLVRPTRTVGSMRVYSDEEIQRLRLIKHLVDEVGMNLAGVQRFLPMAEVAQRLRSMTADRSLRRMPASAALAKEIERLLDLMGL